MQILGQKEKSACLPLHILANINPVKITIYQPKPQAMTLEMSEGKLERISKIIDYFDKDRHTSLSKTLHYTNKNMPNYHFNNWLWSEVLHNDIKFCNSQIILLIDVQKSICSTHQIDHFSVSLYIIYGTTSINDQQVLSTTEW